MFLWFFVRSSGTTKVPTTPTFPHGLPESLKAQVLHQQHDGSDSEHSGAYPFWFVLVTFGFPFMFLAAFCSCKDPEACTCGATSTRPHRGTREERRNSSSHASGSSSVPSPMTPADNVMQQPAATVVLAHAKGRPVLPKPPSGHSNQTQHSPLSPRHPSSVTSQVQPNSQMSTPPHERMYSPYGHAYEYQHLTSEALPRIPLQQSFVRGEPSSDSAQAAPSLVPTDELYPSPNDDFSWLSNFSPRAFGLVSPSSMLSPPSICGCGPGCACLGCVEHRGSDADTTQRCINPLGCMACFGSLTLPSPRNLRFDSMPISPDPEDGLQSIDDWLLPAPLNTSPAPSMNTMSFSHVRTSPAGNRYAPLPQGHSTEDVHIDPKLRSATAWRTQDQIQTQWSSSTGSTSTSSGDG